MEIVIPDLEDDDEDDLPLPRFPGHGFGHPPSNSVTSPQRTASPLPEGGGGAGSGAGYGRPRGDSDASIDAPSTRSFAFAQCGARYTPVYYHDEAGSTTSLHSPIRPALKQRTGSTSSQGHYAREIPPNQPAPFLPPYAQPAKKSSFANLKNAFRAATTGGDKGAGANAVPPLPAPSAAGYPSALKNPFHAGRSGSSTNLSTGAGSSRPIAQRAPASTTGTGIERRDRAKKPSGHSVQSHATRPSEYSYTTTSTSSSSFTAHADVLPPSWPIGQIPQPLARALRPSAEHTRAEPARSAVPEPRTPAEYGLHVAFRRFVSSADDKMRTLLVQPLNRHLPFAFWAGPDSDPAFEDVLGAMAAVARGQGRPVIDSIMGWSNTQKEGISRADLEAHAGHSMSSSSSSRPGEVTRQLSDRKSLGAVYVVHRALSFILDHLPKDALQGALGANLEQYLFDAYRYEQPEALAVNAHRSEIAAITTDLIGKLSKHRSSTLINRFIGTGSELDTLVPLPNPSREVELRVDYLLKGLRSFSLKTYPDTELEKSAEVLDGIAELFSKSHSMGVKLAFADTLVKLLHTLPTVMDAETNHPTWAKAIAAIHGRAAQLATKPRFWHQTFPIAVISLCVSPGEAFKEKWQVILQQAMERLGDKAARVIAYNGIVRLVWVYLHRCRDSSTSTARRLDQILGQCMLRKEDEEVAPTDVQALTNLIHVIFSHDPDYGQQVVSDLLDVSSQSTVASGQYSSLTSAKIQIATHATLLSLMQTSRGATQGWPTNSDFQQEILPSVDEIAIDPMQQIETYKGVELGALRGKMSDPIIDLINSASRTLEPFNLFNDNFVSTEAYKSSSGDSLSNTVLKRRSGLHISYPKSACVQIDLLKVFLSVTPRILASRERVAELALAASSAITQVEPDLRKAAQACVSRMLQDETIADTAIISLTNVVFDTNRVFGVTSVDFASGHKRRLELLSFWKTCALGWITGLSTSNASRTDEICAIEAGAVFLLVSPDHAIRTIAAEVLAATADVTVKAKPMSVYNKRMSRLHISSVVSKESGIHGALSRGLQVETLFQHLGRTTLTHQDRDRLLQWCRQSGTMSPLQAALGSTREDESIWKSIFTAELQTLARKDPAVTRRLRHSLSRTVGGLHDCLPATGGHETLAGSDNAVPARSDWTLDTAKDTLAYFEWYLCALCSVTVPDDQVAVDPAAKEYCCRDLLLLTTPYLSMLGEPICDVTIQGLVCIPDSIAYSVIHHMQKLQSHAIDDPKRRPKNETSRPDLRRDTEQSHLFLAVSRAYALLAPVVGRLPIQQNLDVALCFVGYLNSAYLYLADEGVPQSSALRRLQWDFCQVIEQFSMAIAGYRDADRLISTRARGAMFRLCQKWCQLSRPEKSAIKLDAGSSKQSVDSPETELSWAAGHAMAALCHNPMEAYEDEEYGANRDRQTSAAQEALAWANGLLTSRSQDSSLLGGLAVKGLIQLNWAAICDEAFYLVYVEDMAAPLESSLFHCVANSFLAAGTKLPFAQAAVLALTRLGHKDLRTRLLAMQVLDRMMEPTQQNMLAAFYGSITSPSEKVWSVAQTEAAALIAAMSGDGPSVILEVCTRAPLAAEDQAHGLLAVLTPWIAAAQLKQQTSAASLLDAILYLDIKLSGQHPRAVSDLWSRLMDGEDARIQLILLYLIRQATARSNTQAAFNYARRAVSNFAGQPATPAVFAALMSLVDSEGLLCHPVEHPAVDASYAFCASVVDETLGNLSSTEVVAPGQMAALLAGQVVAETNPNSQVDMSLDSVKLLHALLAHVDADSELVRLESRAVLCRCIATWTGSEHDSAINPQSQRNTLLSALATGAQQYWSAETDTEHPPAFVPHTMAELVSNIVECLTPRHLQLRQLWGTQALSWATECTLPVVACRSFQMFRVLMSDVSAEMLSSIISRYSVTIAGTSTVVRKFNAEVLHTLCCIVQATSAGALVEFPQLLWSCGAALQTPVEREYQLAVDLLAFLLDKVDVSDPSILTNIMRGDPGAKYGRPVLLQPLLTRGLTSSRTMLGAFDIIRRLAGITSPVLIDRPDSRLACTITATLPWLIQADEVDEVDAELVALAEDIAALCDASQEADMARIMRSFAQRRFRAKGEFTKQAISCFRNFIAVDAIAIVGHLAQMLLNKEVWVKRRALQIVCALAKEPQVRTAMETLGPEAVVPALRLLATPLAPLALEFLEIPATFSDASVSADIVRSSLANWAPGKRGSKVTLGRLGDYDEESGWHSGDASGAAEDCKRTMEAVVATFEPATRARSAHFSTLQFDKRVDLVPISPPPLPSAEIPQAPLDQQASLGDLVGALHDLSSFFSESAPDAPTERVVPLSPRGRQAGSEANERKVRAILARSLLRRSSQSPIDWTRGANIAAASEDGSHLNGAGAPDPVQDGDMSADRISIADQLSRWRGQSAHGRQASFSSIGSRSLCARSGGSQFDLDEQELESDNLGRSMAMLGSANRLAWSHESPKATRAPASMRNFVLNGERPTTPRGY